MSTQESRHYEVVCLVHPDQSEHIDSLIEHQKNLIVEGGGVVHRLENWGRRHLAYSIANVHKAHYLLLNIECDIAVLESLEKWFKFNDAVLRKLVVLKKSAITNNSAMYEAIKREEKGEKNKARIDSNKVTEVSYNDLDFLGKYIMENGRIIPARISGAKASVQRKIAHAVKLARYISLLPYCDRHK